MKINRMMTNLCCKSLEESKVFYTSLFDFKVSFDSDWFVHLVSEVSGFELGLIIVEHEIVPKETLGNIQGVYLTFVVDNVDSFYSECQLLGCTILESPKQTPYGQKRLLVAAPEGTVCDVSSPS
ncbi:hypothetical protein KO489_03080 [Reinekea forsetii]|nr:hypothetical protein [Reinekea forsetii]